MKTNECFFIMIVELVLMELKGDEKNYTVKKGVIEIVNKAGSRFCWIC